MTRLICYNLLLIPFFTGAENFSPIGTFSIVARDPQSGEIGVAVQSKFVAVGAVVPYAMAGVGAIATQALGNPRYGPVGLGLLESGKSAKETIEILTHADPMYQHRQLGILPVQGTPYTFTGSKCMGWAGGKTGENFTVQGNILEGAEVVEEMAYSFEDFNGTLAERMLAALEAGQRAGGDKRGRQSASLLVVREGWGYSGLNDRFRDIRVDDHTQPIIELKRIYRLHRKIFPRPKNNSAKNILR